MSESLRQAVLACSNPSPEISEEKINLITSITWMDVIVGEEYLRLLQTTSVPVGNEDSSSESEIEDWEVSDRTFHAPSDEDIQSAKEDADYLIDICKSMGYKIEVRKTCKDGRERQIRRWPRYGDIITLPRDWVIQYLARDQEPEEERRDKTALRHKYDDRWWSDDPSNELGFEKDRFEILTVDDLDDFDIARISDSLDIPKTKAIGVLLTNHGKIGFSKEFRNYVGAQNPYVRKIPDNRECWKSFARVLAGQRKLASIRNEKYLRLLSWAKRQVYASKKIK